MEQEVKNENAVQEEQNTAEVNTEAKAEKEETTVEAQETEVKVEEPTIEETEEPKAEEVKEEVVAEKAEEPKEEKKEEVKEEATEEIESSEESEETEEGEEDEDEEEEEDLVDYTTFSKQELIEKIEALAQEENVVRFRNSIGKIRLAFLPIVKEEKAKLIEQFVADGGKAEEFKMPEDELNKRFNEAFRLYKEKKKVHSEQQEKIKAENLVKKNELLDKLRELINSEEPLKQTYDKFNELQEEWKNIGIIPKAEVNTLWQNYHFLVEKFFDKVKINKELRDLDLKKNLEKKIELCEKTEELLVLESSVVKSFKQLQQYHQDWKEIGPVPHDKNDEIWERFKTATDKINQRRKEYYEKLHEEQENNLTAKTALCEKVEEVVSKPNEKIKDWNDRTDEVNELMKLWKTLGPAPRKHNDEIWARFKGTIDEFFKNKKEYFDTLKDEQMNNYNLKIDICTQAEAIKESSDWKAATDQLINLQKEWKAIGPVPRKHSDKIWKRFRAACDEFFNRKQAHFSNIKEEEDVNLKKKEEIIGKIEGYEFDEDREENLKVIKDFQREFHDIGHVPFKKKNEIHQKFREVINNTLDKLQLSQSEISAMSYKARMDNVIDNPRAGKIIGKERSAVNTKINKIKNDINLWENNIGFLANSAKADLLKTEFEKKIQKAKDELVVLEAKLKYLNEELNKSDN